MNDNNKLTCWESSLILVVWDLRQDWIKLNQRRRLRCFWHELERGSLEFCCSVQRVSMSSRRLTMKYLTPLCCTIKDLKNFKNIFILLLYSKQNDKINKKVSECFSVWVLYVVLHSTKNFWWQVNGLKLSLAVSLNNTHEHKPWLSISPEPRLLKQLKVWWNTKLLSTSVS